MANYTKSTNFASKDSLTTGNPLKTLSGTELDDEFNNIATAVATKANASGATLTGTPTAPTAASSTNSTQLATTAFTQAVVTAGVDPKADLAGPTFTGVPKAPTAATSTDTTQLATTAYVKANVVEVQDAIDLKSNLSGPTFTGVPKAPTAAAGTDTTQLATTAFVQASSLGTDGTWTPTATVGTVTYGTATYAKRGNMVTLYLGGVRFSEQSSNSNLRITNLPFSASANQMGMAFMVGISPTINNCNVLAPANGQVSNLSFFSNDLQQATYAHINNPLNSLTTTITYMTDD